MRGALALFAVGAWLAAPSASPGLAAQQMADAAPGGSVLNLLPVGERAARAPSELLGELGADDLFVPGGQRVQAWLLEAQEGEAVRIDLTSNDFDAYLYLVGPGLGEGLSDDDGGSGLNSRLCVVLPANGTYRVVAGSLGGGTGRYSLSLADDADRTEDAAGRDGAAEGSCGDDGGGNEIADLASLSTEGRVAEVGAEQSGVLPFHGASYVGSPVQAWALRAGAGREVTVDLRSGDFDAYLRLLGPGIDDPLTDDDGAGGCDARITFAAPEEGVYRVIVSSLGSSGGAFTLAVHDDPPPPDARPCVPAERSDGSGVDSGTDVQALPVSGAIALGDFVTESLRGGGTQWRGSPVQVWSYEGRAGERIRIDLRSDAFDAYLGIHGPGFESAATNDDGGEGLDSRLCVELPEDGEYRLLAGTFSSSASGGYTLEVSAEGDAPCGTLTLSPEQRARVLDATEPRGSLVPEVEVHGSLAADDPRHPDRAAPIAVWSLEGEAGRHLSVDLVSEDFDPYLYLSGPGLPEVLSNDDGAGCLDSRIAVTFPENGTYRIVATGFGESARGAYRLIATSEPEEDRACATTGSTGTVSSDILEGVTVPDSRILQRPVVSTLARRTGGTVSQLAGLELGGRLADGDAELGEGRPAQGWGLQALEGDRFVIELLSDDFDANLYLDGPGMAEAFHDDDGAGGLDSRLDVTMQADGLFRIVVTSNSGGEGAYTLRILRRVGRD